MTNWHYVAALSSYGSVAALVSAALVAIFYPEMPGQFDKITGCSLITASSLAIGSVPVALLSLKYDQTMSSAERSRWTTKLLVFGPWVTGPYFYQLATKRNASKVGRDNDHA